jgi:PAS domain S-box-containing protein
MVDNSLRKRLRFLFLILSIAPILTAGILISWNSYRIQLEHAIEHQNELASHKAEQVAAFILEIEDELNLTTYLNDLPALDTKNLQLNLALLIGHNDAYENIYLIDAAGNMLGWVSRTGISHDEQDSAGPLAAVPNTTDTYFGPVEFHENSGEPFMTIVVPIIAGHTGAVTHFLVAEIQLKKMWELVAETHDEIVDRIYIIDSQNKLIAHRNPALVLQGTIFQPPTESVVSTGLDGRKSILGIEKINLGANTWTVVSEISLAAALNLTWNLLALTGILVFAALISSIYLGIVVIGQIIRPVELMAAAAHAISTGDLTRRLKIKRTDEIGTLAAAFNSMAVDLEMLFESLEKKVTERTQDLKVAQIATLSMMEAAEEARFNAEQANEEMKAAQIATLNMMMDGDEARQKAEQANIDLTKEVAERVRAEDLLLLEKSFSDHIINSIPGVFYVFDEHGKFIRWNDNFTKITEYSDDEIAQMHPTQLFTGADVDYIAARIQLVFYKGVSNAEAYFTTKSGRKTPFYFTGYRTLIDGTPILIGTGFDITERKQAEAALNRRTKELERSNQELEQFAYVASHDLQEPLRMVASYLQLLEKRYGEKLGEDAKDFIRYAVDGATRMKRLINDLLTYSRVGTRGNPFEITDLNMVLEQVQSNLEAAIIESGAIISTETLPTVFSDETQMMQLFQNLIGNAIKFSHPDKTPDIDIQVHQKNSAWEIAVSDNGIGFDPQFAERIFVIFQRLHGKNEYTGTGIGLAISKRIVERHGGQIWTVSNLGEGATFKFSLPIITANESDLITR